MQVLITFGWGTCILLHYVQIVSGTRPILYSVRNLRYSYPPVRGRWHTGLLRRSQTRQGTDE